MNMRIDIPLIERIAALLDPYRDDGDLFMDSLDSQTDVLDLMDRSLAAMQADEALAQAIKSQEDALAKRRQRIESRRDAHKAAVREMLRATGQKKVERPLATLSMRQGSVAVHIHDDASVPTQLCKVTRTPDKAAIRKQIEAGEDVPGAYLVRGEDTLSVRVL